MLPLRLVIDINVLVSAALKPEGLQRTALVLAVTKPALFYVSHPILEEYAVVLSRPELAIRKRIRQQLLQLVKNHSHIVTPSRRLEVCTDPDDNVFLECADTARADYLMLDHADHFTSGEEGPREVTGNSSIQDVPPIPGERGEDDRASHQQHRPGDPCDSSRLTQ